MEYSLSFTAWSSEQMEHMNISFQYILLSGSFLSLQLWYFFYEWTQNQYTHSFFPVTFLYLMFVSAKEVKFHKRLRLPRVAVFRLLVSELLYTHYNHWGPWGRFLFLFFKFMWVLSSHIYHIRNYNCKYLRIINLLS